MVISPGFNNEKKVEHLGVINELYTKAYELFKRHTPGPSQGQGRFTLWIAYRIAQTYYDAGKFDMAVRYVRPPCPSPTVAPVDAYPFTHP